MIANHNVDVRGEEVTSFFDEDHDVLQSILGDVATLAEVHSPSAAKRFGEFRRLVEERVHDEELVLLPAYVGRGGDPDEVVSRLQAEHSDLFRRMESLSAALSQQDEARVRSELPKLEQRLAAHASFEARVLHAPLKALIPTRPHWERLVDHARRRDRRGLEVGGDAGPSPVR